MIFWFLNVGGGERETHIRVIESSITCIAISVRKSKMPFGVNSEFGLIYFIYSTHKQTVHRKTKKYDVLIWIKNPKQNFFVFVFNYSLCFR